MAAITAAMVKELRESTGAGMMDCKKALASTDGDMEKAVEYLREKGLAASAKKAGRIAAEGVVKTLVRDDKVAAIVEVNSETDFVARNADFNAYVEDVIEQVIDSPATDIDAFLAETWKKDPSKTVAEQLSSEIAIIGENLKIRRFERIKSDGLVVSYIHGAGKIGVLVESDSKVNNDEVKEALKNLAMQIAAMNPQYLSSSDISADELAKLEKITVESALNDPASLPKPILQKLIDKAVADKKWSDETVAIYEEKKSNMQFLFNFLPDEAKAALAALAVEDKENITNDKIFGGLVKGRVSKQLKEICLTEQTYVKAEDGKQTVAAYLKEVSKKAGCDVNVVKFVRFETGEGLEKKEENFAEEVAKQMNS